MHKQTHGSAAPGTIQDVTEMEFDTEVLAHAGAVLVDFSTTWCGPCRALTPILRELATEQRATLKVVAVDGDTAPSLTARYGVRGFPTVILFKDGKEVSRRLGLTTKKRLAAMLQTD